MYQMYCVRRLFSGWLILAAVVFFALSVYADSGAEQKDPAEELEERLQLNELTFEEYCRMSMEYSECHKDRCQLLCLNEEVDEQGECLEPVCVPRECPDISAKECPLQFCSLMTNCSGERICHYQMAGGSPLCGGLAYGGQDVECCDGLIRRCGIEFMDGTCDMEGRNSVYHIPICIPCGNGVCGQFENRCNCPEDCGEPPK